MRQPVLSVLLYSLIPVVAALLGAILAVIRQPGAALRSAIQHFAAGVVFSVVAVELLPDIVRQHRPLWVVIGFALGIASMLSVRWFTESKLGTPDEDHPRAFPVSLVAAIGIDIVIDGFLVGIGFA